MKTAFFAFIGFILLLFGAFVWKNFDVPSFVVRYRLTLEIDTPNGLRQGSSVIEMAAYIRQGKALLSEASGDRVVIKGEAAFVDLGNGKNVIALLDGGSVFLQGVFSHSMKKSIKLADLAKVSGIVALDQPTNIRGNQLLPTIITFTDINDPASAKVVYATDYKQVCNKPPGNEDCGVKDNVAVPIDEIAATFGPGHAFKRVTLEIVPNDTPITRGIEARLPWWNGPNRPAAIAARAAGLPLGAIDVESFFIRGF